VAPNAVADASVNAQARPEDGLSSAALLTAVFGVVPVSIPLGIAGLVRTKGGGRTGRGRAVVSLIVSGLWIVLLAAGFVYYNSSGLPLTRWSNPNAVRVGMADLRSNQCVTLPVVVPRHQIWLNVVDCSVAHNAEVYALGDLPGVGTYPGDGQVNKLVRSRCDAALIPFSGTAHSKLDVFLRHAGRAGWNAQSDAYVCLAVSDDNVTGSMAGTG
jgi:hypothetical protein